MRTASTSDTTTPDTDRKRKRGTVIKLSLAAVALLGIGAAATSAAWTDDAWFSASASGAKVELQGSLNDTTFSDADLATSALVIPSTTFADLNPGETRTVVVYVKNTSTVDLDVAAPTLATVAPSSGVNLFGGAAPVSYSAALTTGTVAPLAVGDEASYTVTVTAPEWANDNAAYQGATGTLTIKFTGTTEAQ